MKRLKIGKEHCYNERDIKRLKKKVSKKSLLPKIGEQFSRRMLPEIPLKMYLKLSQIYGIPLKELLPYRGKNVNPLYVMGEYNRYKHEIRVFPTLGSKIRKLFKKEEPELASENIITEELLHSVQALLQKAYELLLERRIEEYERKRAKTRKDRERIKRLKKKIFPENKRAEEIALGIEPSAKPHIKGDLKSILDSIRYSTSYPSIPLGYIARNKVRKYFERYGPDGLLLLYADPPKEWNMALLDEKEKFFVENGLLEPGKGLTKKGMQYMREKVPREIILKALSTMRKKREKR